jgi:hypothetical protein
MEDKAYIVYLHINPKNKKVYVGTTNQDVYRRWKNGHGYTKCKKFYNAIMKYGWDNFKHAVLQLDSNDNIINRFSSASEAERHLNGKGSHISCCCLGKRKTAYGYKWKYE